MISRLAQKSLRTLSTLPTTSAYQNHASEYAAEIQTLHDNFTYKHERTIVGMQGKCLFFFKNFTMSHASFFNFFINF